MGKVSGNWITGTHSGRACRHDDIYTKVNKRTGACYSVKLCNPATEQNAEQLKSTSAFSLVSAAISSWIKSNKASLSADYKKVQKAFEAQKKYSYLRTLMFAKGMYSVSADPSTGSGQVQQTVTVDITKRTDFKTAFGIEASSGSEGSSGSNGSNGGAGGNGSQNQNTTTYTLNISSANEEQGTVNTSVNKSYNSGASVSIQASAKEGYKFDQWNDGNKNASRTLTMTQNYTLVASFKVDDGSDEEPDQEIS